MAQENFNVSQPNDGLGDKLRAAFIKVQSNFTDLFTEKVDKEVGKGLSANDYTTTEKNKLANIEDFAELNVQADFLQNDNTQDDFIKNKPSIPVLDDYVLNGGYAGTAQDLDDAIEAGGQLVKVTENGKTGYRLKDADPANYGDIGDDAVDLSIPAGASTTRGATGDYSHASGNSTTASGYASNAEGENTTASGDYSHASGVSTIASGDASTASGNITTASGLFAKASGVSTIASGDASTASNIRTFARSLAEHSGGINGTDYTPQSVTGFDLTDRLVNYGNGADTSNRSDAYTLFKNGMQKFFTAALNTITNAVKGSVMLDENARLNIHDGTAFKAVAFSSEVDVKISGSGTTNKLAKFTSSGLVGDSAITELANRNVGIDQPTPTEKLDVVGNGKFSGTVTAGEDISANGLTVGRGGGNISSNSANGLSALRNNTTGGNNTANGAFALQSSTTAATNTAIGASSLRHNTLGGGNIANGVNAGRFIGDGSNATNVSTSVFLGTDTKALANSQTNQIVIGHTAIGAGSNTVTLGNTAITNTILRGAVSFAQFTTATEPAYLKGAQFFNTTLDKMRIGGATAYETVTSS